MDEEARRAGRRYTLLSQRRAAAVISRPGNSGALDLLIFLYFPQVFDSALRLEAKWVCKQEKALVDDAVMFEFPKLSYYGIFLIIKVHVQ